MQRNEQYAIYVRVSSDEQARCKEGSITSQIQRLEEYLKLKRDKTPYIIYREVASGKDTRRPEFQKLVKDIERGKISVVLSTELSRMNRSVMDFLQFFELCNNHNVGLVCLRENFDTTTSQGRLIMSIFASLAQFEREQISERTSANLQARAARGLHNGGYIYGYRQRPNQKGYLDIDEHEALVINFMYDKYLECGSYCKVADILNEEGYKKREYTSRRGKFHPSSAWTKTSVLQILQNPVYISKRKTKKEMVKAVWEPIIAIEKWRKVQRILKKNLKIRGNSVKPNKHHTYLFSGLVKCIHCNAMLENGSGTGNRNGLYFYYRHKSKTKKKDCPHPSSLPAKELENLVCEQILGLIDNDDLLGQIADETSGKLQQDIFLHKKNIEHFEKRLEELEKQSSGLVNKLGFLSHEQVQEFISPRLKEISEEKKNLEGKISKCIEKIEDLSEYNLSSEDIKYMISSLANEFHQLNSKQMQCILEMMIEKIELHCEEIRIFLRVYKEELFELDKKFEKLLGWLPGLDSNQRPSG